MKATMNRSHYSLPFVLTLVLPVLLLFSVNGKVTVQAAETPAQRLHRQHHNGSTSLEEDVSAAQAVASTSAKTNDTYVPDTSTGSTVVDESNGTYYAILYRPSIHYSPGYGFMNDPNGLIYNGGTYHLYFQHNPTSAIAGNTTWGHATSDDLLHWVDQPTAIEKSSTKGLAFTGSAVLDVNDSSGLFTNVEATNSNNNSINRLVAIFTRAETYQQQYLAWSTDYGYSYPNELSNPVVPSTLPNFRDPQVQWHAASSQWIMTVSRSRDHYVEFHGSTNLINWTLLSHFGPAGLTGIDWECPNMIEVPVVNSSTGTIIEGSTRWVLFISVNPGAPLGGSGTQYFLGNFNGTHFVPESPQGLFRWLDFGKDNYAMQVYNNVSVNSNGNVRTTPVYVGWLGNWQYAQETPSYSWRGIMALPRSFVVKNDTFGVEMLSQSVAVSLEPLRSGVTPMFGQHNDDDNTTRMLPAGATSSHALNFTVPTEGEDNESTTTTTTTFTTAMELNLTTKHSVPSDAPFDSPALHPRFLIQFANDNDENLTIGYDISVEQLWIDRNSLKGFAASHTTTSDTSRSNTNPFYPTMMSVAINPAVDATMTWYVILDASTLELFVNDGIYVASVALYPQLPFTRIQFVAENYEAQIVSVSATALRKSMSNRTTLAQTNAAAPARQGVLLACLLVTLHLLSYIV